MISMKACAPKASGHLKLSSHFENSPCSTIRFTMVHVCACVGRDRNRGQLCVTELTCEIDTWHLQCIIVLFETLTKAFCSRLIVERKAQGLHRIQIPFTFFERI